MNFKLLAKIVLFFTSAVFGSCNETSEPAILIAVQNGTYTGTFQRFSGEHAGKISMVEMNFDNGRWEGTSSIPKYPALCAGEYTLENGEITFTNECFWTAEFDWSLILSGTFKLKKTSTEMTFEKTMGTGNSQIKDVYIFQMKR